MNDYILDMAVCESDLRLLSRHSRYILTGGIARRERERSVAELERFFFAIQKAFSLAAFAEIGAHRAKKAIKIASMFPDAEVRAYEANPRTYKSMCKVRSITERNIKYIHSAIGSAAGHAAFYLPLSSPANENGDEALSFSVGGSLLPALEQDGADKVDIPCARLDDVFASVPGNISLVVDVEGGVREVLEGGREMMEKVAAAMIRIEDAPLWKDQWLAHDVMKFMQAHGFIPLARDFASEQQYSVVFVKSWLFRLNDVRRALDRLELPFSTADAENAGTGD